MQVTWEERWQSLLAELEVDVSRRCVTLRAEAARVAARAAAAGRTHSSRRARSEHAHGWSEHGRHEQRHGAVKQEVLVRRWAFLIDV
jgi:hypothetical protein